VLSPPCLDAQALVPARAKVQKKRLHHCEDGRRMVTIAARIAKENVSPDAKTLADAGD
jgi:hypothetical protein